MSWSSGSEIFSEIIESIKTVVDYDERVNIYEALILVFEDRDCDTLEECIEEDLAFEEAYYNASQFASDDQEDLEDSED